MRSPKLSGNLIQAFYLENPKSLRTLKSEILSETCRFSGLNDYYNHVMNLVACDEP